MNCTEIERTPLNFTLLHCSGIPGTLDDNKSGCGIINGIHCTILVHKTLQYTTAMFRNSRTLDDKPWVVRNKNYTETVSSASVIFETVESVLSWC